MRTTPLPNVHWTGAVRMCMDSRRRELIPFTSTCPSCNRDQPQPGFTRAALERLLGGGYPVEAYCVRCDQFWAVDFPERLALVEDPARSVELQRGPLRRRVIRGALIGA